METEGSRLAGLDWAVIVAFFAIIVGIGVFYSRRQKTSEQFFGGDKTMPWWLAGISFYMCTFSALAFVMYSAIAYKFGFVAVTISWGSPIAVLIGARLTAAKWRRVATNSPLEYIERRFGNGMRQGLMWLGLPMRIFDDAAKLLAIGTVVGVGLGFPISWAIAVSAVIVAMYTFMGGLKAALVADFFQFIVLLVVVLALPLFCCGELAKLDGGSGIAHGFANFLKNAPEGLFALTSDKYTWVYVIVLALCSVVNNCTSWSLVQRYYSTRSEKDAVKVGYLVSFLIFIAPPIFYFPAMAAREFLPALDMASPDAMNGVFATICTTVLPAGMIGMVVAAMFSATMSTLAGDFNAIAAVFTNDFYARMLSPNASQRAKMAVARISTLAVAAFVVALAFFVRQAQGASDLLDVVNKMFAVFLPPISFPMMVGFLVRRLSRRSGLVGTLVGMAYGIAAFIAGAWFPVLREMVVMLPSTFAATAVGLVLGTIFLRDTSEESRDIDEFFRKANTPS